MSCAALCKNCVMMLACYIWLSGYRCLVAKGFWAVFNIFLCFVSNVLCGCCSFWCNVSVCLFETYACAWLTRVMFTLYTQQVSGVLTHLVIWLWFQAVCCERSLPQACWLCPLSLWNRGLRFYRGKTLSYLAAVSLFVVIQTIWDAFYLWIFCCTVFAWNVIFAE